MFAMTEEEFKSFWETLTPEEQAAYEALEKRNEELRVGREKNTSEDAKIRMHKRAIERKQLTFKMKKTLNNLSNE